MERREFAPHILILGTNERLRQSCKSVCTERGWQQSEKLSLAEAARSQEITRFDLIVTDLEVPHTEALQCLRDLHQQKPEVPILVVPRLTTPEKSAELLREGATEVLFSPEDSQALKESLERDVALSRASLQAGLFEHTHSSIVTLVLDTAAVVNGRIPLCLAADLEAAGRLDEASRRRLELAFQEALTNAVEHGNLELDSSWREIIDAQGSDKYSAVKKQRLSDVYYTKRKVVISFEYCDDVFSIRVRDEGLGFSPPPDVLREQTNNHLKCSGRGFAIIANSVDELHFGRGGREICMRKHVAPAAFPWKGA